MTANVLIGSITMVIHLLGMKCTLSCPKLKVIRHFHFTAELWYSASSDNMFRILSHFDRVQLGDVGIILDNRFDSHLAVELISEQCWHIFTGTRTLRFRSVFDFRLVRQWYIRCDWHLLVGRKSSLFPGTFSLQWWTDAQLEFHLIHKLTLYLTKIQLKMVALG